MKLEEVYIKIGSKKEVESIKNTLELLGEKIYEGSFYNGHEKELGLHKSGSWWCSNGYEGSHTEISIKELICMICNKPKEIRLFPEGTATVIIKKNGMSILDKLGTFYSGDQIEQMYTAYKSLQ